MTLGRCQRGRAGAVGAADAGELELRVGAFQSLIPLRLSNWSCSPSVGQLLFLDHDWNTLSCFFLLQSP